MQTMRLTACNGAGAMTPATVALPRSRARCCSVQASNDFRLSKMTSSRQVTQSVPTHEPSTSAPSGPNVLGVVAVCGLAFFAFLKSRRAISALLDKLPWSKQSRDLDVVRGLNAIPSEGLPEDIIKAARARRSKERANHKLRMEEVELPDNHPWATKQKVAKEEEQNIRARLSLRRSTPPQQPPRDDAGGRQRPAQDTAPNQGAAGRPSDRR